MSEVKTWRDSVSKDLGKILATQEEMNKHLNKINGTLDEHDKRIDCVEKKEIERAAVKKFTAWFWATFGGLLVWGLNKLWPVIVKIFS